MEELATAKPSNGQGQGRQNFWNYAINKEQWPKGATLGVLLNFKVYWLLESLKILFFNFCILSVIGFAGKTLLVLCIGMGWDRSPDLKLSLLETTSPWFSFLLCSPPPNFQISFRICLVHVAECWTSNNEMPVEIPVCWQTCQIALNKSPAFASSSTEVWLIIVPYSCCYKSSNDSKLFCLLNASPIN